MRYAPFCGRRGVGPYPGPGRALCLLLVLALVLAAEALGATRANAQTPGPCVPLEAQSWWQKDGPLPFQGDMQHVHVGACFPFKQVISGNYTLDVTVKMHNEAGRYLTQVRIDDDTDQDPQVRFGVNPMLLCSTADCTFTVPLTVPTGTLPAGMHEWRVGASTAPRASNSSTVPERALTSDAWQVCIRSCSGRTPANDREENRGWYRTLDGSTLSVKGYDEANWGWLSSHDAEFPWNPSTHSYVPVSGTWRPPVNLHQGSQTDSTDPITRSRAYVDPDFHHGIVGIQVLNVAGPFQGRLSIDTTKLSNGMHKLVLEAGSGTSLTGDLLSAVGVIPFLVQNP